MQHMQIDELSELIQTREVSPVEVTELILERINVYDGALHSYVHVMGAQALADAKQAEQEIAAGKWRGPLHGVPVAVKDQFWIAGTPTAAGTTVLRDNFTVQDSDVARNLRAAGAILVGKVAMSEAAFGYEHPQLPAAVNPWNPALWEGSSSTGAGAAVAAGLCFGAIATDTGGSIRYPAAMSGLTGIKPTHGSVSTRGVAGSILGSMEHIGPMARSARDCQILFDAIVGQDQFPVAERDHLAGEEEQGAPLKVGIHPSAWTGVDKPTLEVLHAAQHVLSGMGHSIHEVELPDANDVIDGWRDRCAVDLAVAHEATFPSRRDEYGPIVADLLDRGRSLLATDLRHILQAQQKFTALLQRTFEAVDVLLMPAIGIAAPQRELVRKIRGTDQWREQMMRWTVPFNVSGNPTLVLPGGFTEQGYPIGFQLAAASNNECVLFSIAQSFQAETAFHRAHPAAFA